MYVLLGTVGGSAVGFVLAMRTSKRFNKKVRESKFFRNSSVFWNNNTIRKSLALPDGLEEIGNLYEEDMKGRGEKAPLIGKSESNH